MRAAMYLLSVLAQDQATQRKGCVGILMNVHPFQRPAKPTDAFRLTNLMANVGPVRYVGYHFCASHKSMILNLQPILLATSPILTRCARIRFHSGTSTKELDLSFTCFASNISILTFSSMLFCRLVTGDPLRSNDLWNPDQGTTSDRSRRHGSAASL